MRGLTLFSCGLMVGVICACAGVGVCADDGGEWTIDLRFADSDEVRHLRSVAWREEERPRFVGEVRVNVAGPRRTYDGHQVFSEQDVLGFYMEPPVEERMLEIVGIMSKIDGIDREWFRDEPNDVVAVSLYGRDRQEVEAIALAFVNGFNRRARQRLQDATRRLDGYRRTAAKLEEEVAALPAERKELMRRLEELKRVVRYTDVEGAQASAREAVSALQSIEIEIAGIEAKLAAIAAVSGGGDVLTAMRLKEEIERTGALARKGAAERFVQQGRDFVAWCERINTIPKLLKDKEEMLSRHQKWIPELERALAEPSADMRPVELVRDVVIRPVLFDADPGRQVVRPRSAYTR